jgi:hypothetical protein
MLNGDSGDSLLEFAGRPWRDRWLIADPTLFPCESEAPRGTIRESRWRARGQGRTREDALTQKNHAKYCPTPAG